MLFKVNYQLSFMAYPTFLCYKDSKYCNYKQTFIQTFSSQAKEIPRFLKNMHQM